MRHRQTLYINGQRADLPDGSPVLFNYTLEELRNPTIVKNSFSRPVELQGTPANNYIFRSYFRLDAAPGSGFNPSKRVPFEVYTDGGVVVEAGYVKLDSVKTQGADITYSVTLYGGLGGFLYGLQYGEEGARSLADLTYYTNEAGYPIEFPVNRSTIATAWSILLSSMATVRAPYRKWRVVNFAPCYNGIPGGDFDASHAIVYAPAAGLQSISTDRAYRARNGFALVDLPEDLDEWRVKDLRSYLQRPVISVRALISAIADSANNGGYTVVLDPEFFNSLNPYYYKAWMTLKQLTALSLPAEHSEQQGSGSTDILTQEYVEFGPYGTGTRPQEGVFSITNVGPRAFTIPSVSESVLYWGKLPSGDYVRGLAVQAVAFDASGNKVGGSKVYAFGPGAASSCKSFLDNCGFTPNYGAADDEELYGDLFGGSFGVSGTTASWNGSLCNLTITAKNVATVRVYYTRVTNSTSSGSPWALQKIEQGSLQSYVTLSSALCGADVAAVFDTFTDKVRSGQTITKAMLLSDTMSPAEFLLSYCKRFGLMLRVDSARKTVHIETRKTFFEDIVTNVADRLDRSREITMVPVPYDVRRFVFSEPDAGAGYSNEYAARFGRSYGAQRLVTGFEFNAETKTLLDSTKFKTAPEVKARALEFVTVSNPARPAVFLRGGLKYHLFGADNSTNELDVPGVPSTVTLDYFDATYKGYDQDSRVQLCDSDGKAVDGDGVLLFLQGSQAAMPYGFALTDDLPEMYLGGRDKPCWLLDPANHYGTAPTLPLFGRFVYEDTTRVTIERSMEFGTPAEIDIPGVTVADGSNVYEAFWRAFMSDRYDPGTKVLTCTVSTAGLRFGADALRRFYWIDGALWALNRITDYDIGGDGLTQCEFVQIQNKENYTA